MTAEQLASEGIGPIRRRDFLKMAGAGSALVGVGGLVGGFGSAASAASNRAAAAAKPKYGGTIRLGITGGGSSDSLNPFLIDTTGDVALCFPVYQPLTYTDAAAKLAYKLAAEFTPNAKATNWTVRLHDGVTFHDGKPLTADDVIYSIQYVVTPSANAIGAAQFTQVDVAGLKKLDNLTVSIPLTSPNAIFPDLISGNLFYIVPEGWTPQSAPNGTGPYKVQSFHPGVQSTLVANENYWLGRPYIDNYVVTDYADETSQVNALLAGDVDLVNSLSTGVINQIRSSGNADVVISKTGSWLPFTIRVDQAPFNDVRVRQAFRLIVDRPQMNEVTSDGLSKIGNDIFSPFDPLYDHDIPQHVQDIPQAKSLLKKAGHEDLTVTLVTAPIGANTVQMATVFAQQAKAAGVKVNLDTVTATELYGNNYLSWKFSQDGWNTHDYLVQASLATIPGPGAENETHFNDPKYTALYKEAIQRTSEKDRLPLAHEMQLIDYNDGGLIIPFFSTNVDGYAKRVHGVEPDASGTSFNGFDVSRYWLD